MAIFLGWITFSFVAAWIASNKGRSGAGFFFLSVLLSPLVGIICAAFAKPDVAVLEKVQIATGEMKKCPACAELVKAEANVCRYCGKELPSGHSRETSTSAAPWRNPVPAPPPGAPLSKASKIAIAVLVVAFVAAALLSSLQAPGTSASRNLIVTLRPSSTELLLGNDSGLTWRDCIVTLDGHVAKIGTLPTGTSRVNLSAFTNGLSATDLEVRPSNYSVSCGSETARTYWIAR